MVEVNGGEGMSGADQKPGLAKTKPSAGWMGMEEAAAFLGLPAVTLRRNIERHARASENGVLVACFDGVTARKLGRLWRVRLDERWTGSATGS